MKAIIDKEKFEDLFDSLFKLKKEEPIRSFKICSIKGISPFVEYTVEVYPSKIALSTNTLLEGTIANIEDGKEKFINDVNTFFNKLKDSSQGLVNHGYIDEVIVKAADHDPHKYVSIKFDEFVTVFTQLMDIFIKEIE